MTDYGYISLKLSDDENKTFHNLVKKICTEGDLYSSEWVHGDVSSDLHLTLFYGLINEKLDKTELKNLMDSIKIDSLKLGEMILLPGYRGQYQVLIIEVVDTDGEIRRICESFKKFPFEESVQHPEYKPHLTLAYVKPDFKLANISDYPKEIKATTVHYNEK